MKRILFVDDETQVLQGLQRMLRPLRKDWDMHFSESAGKALQLMQESALFDVVVTDMRMPQMDGAKLLAQVMELYPHTVRIVLTGHTDNETIFRAAGLSHQFLSKPCEAETLKNVVESAFALREYLSNDRLQQLLTRITTIPSIPDLYLQLLREMRKPDPSLKSLAEVIEQDFGMCAKLLHFVNSAHFGLSHPISSPMQAINYIGLNNLKTLILGNGIFSSVDAARLPKGFSINLLWQHSLKVAAFARAIAKAENVDAKALDDAYMAGLLHDSGTLVLANNMPVQYQAVLDLVRTKKLTLDEAEAEILGASHAEVGAYLLALWGLPDALVGAVAFHQRPSLALGKGFSTLAIVHVADALFWELEQQDNPERSMLDLEYLAQCGVVDRLPVWRELCQEIVRASSAAGTA